MADFTIKAHDLLPPIRVALTQGGSVFDLTNATSIKFIMADQVTLAIKVNATATVEDAAGGIVRYDWQGTDTSVAGEYYGEFQITWPGPKPQTVPSDSYLTISIHRDLDNA